MVQNYFALVWKNNKYMKTFLTLLVLLFSSSISFNSYGGWFDKTVCVETDAQDRNGIIFLPNQTEPFSGNNLCEYENGQVKSKGEIKDGKQDGKWTFWYENGQIASEANYKDGKINGELTSWYENGEIIKTVCIINDLTLFDYLHYLPNESEPFTGNNLCNYENGQVKTKGEIKDGKLDGKWTYWYENGQIEREQYFKDGNIEGKQTSWYENGQKECEAKHDDILGRGKSKVTCWFESGQMLLENNYKDDKLDGKETWWNENGQIEQECYYKDGVLIDEYC